MSKYIIPLFLMLQSFIGFGQLTDATQLNKDWRFFQEALYDIHPSTFRYFPRDSMDALFDSLAFKLNKNASALELEKRMRIILKKVGCIHSNVNKSVFEHNGTIIPFSIFNSKGKIWIKKDLTDSLSTFKGNRLLAINGHLTKNLLDTMRFFRSADGHSQDFMPLYINQPTTFSYLYQYYFDADSTKSYTILTTNNDTIRLNRKNIIPKESKKDRPKGIAYGKHIFLDFDTLHNIAVLKINSFSSIFPIIGKYVNKRKYKKAIKQVQKSGYQQLVLDLRGNLGGDASAGKALLSFFIQDKFKYKTTKKKAHVFKYATTPSKFGYTLDYFFGNLFAMRRPSWKKRETTVTVRRNRRHHFDGKLMVFTDGFTASTASIVASSLKYKTNTTIIGRESGGGENDLNAYYYPVIQLPYSKIKVRLPLYHFDLNLTPNRGNGVLPDIPVEYGIEDILLGRDLDLDAARILSER